MTIDIESHHDAAVSLFFGSVRLGHELDACRGDTTMPVRQSQAASQLQSWASDAANKASNSLDSMLRQRSQSTDDACSTTMLNAIKYGSIQGSNRWRQRRSASQPQLTFRQEGSSVRVSDALGFTCGCARLLQSTLLPGRSTPAVGRTHTAADRRSS